MHLAFMDVKKAYYASKVVREMFVKLLPGDEEEGMCGKLVMAMYGTRDAGASGENVYSEALIKIGFTQGKASPCCFIMQSGISPV